MSIYCLKDNICRNKTLINELSTESVIVLHLNFKPKPIAINYDTIIDIIYVLNGLRQTCRLLASDLLFINNNPLLSQYLQTWRRGLIWI